MWPAQIPTVQAAHVTAIHAGDNPKLRCRTSHCAVPTMAPQTIQAHKPGNTNQIPMVHASVFAAIHQKARPLWNEGNPRPEYGSAARRSSFSSQAEFALGTVRMSFPSSYISLMNL